MQRNILFVTVLLLNIALLIPKANASIISYTDRTAYMQALAGTTYAITNINFDTATQTAQNKPENLISASGITIQEMPNGAGGLSLTTSGTNGAAVEFAFNNRVNISLPTNSYAFGFEIGNTGSYYTTPPALTGLTLSTGEVFDSIVGTKLPPAYSFFGFISDTPVTSFIFKPSNTLDALLDNFVYAQGQAAPVPVPEPTTFALLALGLTGLTLVGRKK